MKQILILCAINILFCNIAFSKKSIHKSEISITYSVHELKFAKHYLDLIDEYKKRKIKKYTINGMASLLKKTNLFNFLKNDIHSIQKIMTNSSIKNFNKVCLSNKSNKVSNLKFSSANNDGPNYILLKKIKNMLCQKSFIHNISKIKIKLDNNHKIFFEKNSYYYFGRRYKKTISKILKNNTLLANQIKKIFYDTYESKNYSLNNYYIKLLKLKTNKKNVIKNDRLFKENRLCKKNIRQSSKLTSVSFEKDDDNIYDIINNHIKTIKRCRRSISKSRQWKYLISAGKKLVHIKKYNRAYYIFKEAYKIENNKHKNETYFYLLWPYIASNNSYRSVRLIERYKLNKNFDQLNPKTKFWIAQSYLNHGRKIKAKKLFSKVVSMHSLNYYSILSLKKLNIITSKTYDKKFKKNYTTDKNIFVPISQKSLKNNINYSLKRIAIWSDLKYEKYINKEITFANQYKKKGALKSELHNVISELQFKQSFTSLLLSILQQKKQYLTSFKVVYRSIANNTYKVDKGLLKFLFPTPFKKLISKNSKDINSILVLSLIRQESAFNPRAMSHAGARGLMQLMLPTAKRVKKGVKRKHLHNPEVNISVGIKYLKKLLAKYNNNIIFSLAAYNAGEYRIKKWTETVFKMGNPLLKVESIPYKETRQYVKLIYRNIFFYNLLNNQENINESIERSFFI